MGGLILCTGKEGNKPFYLNSAGININSLDELCYFLYNNIYVLNPDVINAQLADYIEEELEEKALADKLRELLRYKEGLGELVMAVLNYTNYYTKEEIGQIKKALETLNTQNVLERLKARADNFLANMRLNSAIENYMLIVSRKKDKKLDEIFYGNVWHNMGVAFSKMFLFTEALSCFDKAYRIGGNEESRRQYMCTLVILDNKNKNFNRTDFESESDEEIYYKEKKNIEQIINGISLTDEYAALRNAVILKEDGMISEYYNTLAGIIDNWKIDYHRMAK